MFKLWNFSIFITESFTKLAKVAGFWFTWIRFWSGLNIWTISASLRPGDCLKFNFFLIGGVVSKFDLNVGTDIIKFECKRLKNVRLIIITNINREQDEDDPFEIDVHVFFLEKEYCCGTISKTSSIWENQRFCFCWLACNSVRVRDVLSIHATESVFLLEKTFWMFFFEFFKSLLYYIKTRRQ